MPYRSRKARLACKHRSLQRKRDAGECQSCPAPAPFPFRQCFRCRVRLSERRRKVAA
jgi:hypothetical protein